MFEGKAEVAKSFTAPGDWLNAGIPVYEYNPEKAKELLKEAGWPSDYTLDVVYYYDDQQTVDLMTIIGQYWQEVGREGTVQEAGRRSGGPAVGTAGRYGEGSVSSEVGFSLCGSGSPLPRASSIIVLHLPHPITLLFPNRKGLDEMIAASNATMDVGEQKEAFYKIQQFVAENELAMPLYHQVCFIYTSDKLDTAGSAFGNDQFSYEKNILDWKIDRG